MMGNAIISIMNEVRHSTADQEFIFTILKKIHNIVKVKSIIIVYKLRLSLKFNEFYSVLFFFTHAVTDLRNTLKIQKLHFH